MRLRAFALRRTKEQVLKDLPSKTRQLLPVALSRGHARKTQQILDEVDGDPFLAMGKIRHLDGMAKVPAAVDWITNTVLNSGEQVVVFCWHRDVVAALAEKLYDEISSGVIAGETPAAAREERVRAFQAGEIAVLICSSAAKEGITLTAARYTLHVERFWVPGDERQSEDRISRIGQTRKTWHVYLHLEQSSDAHVHALIGWKSQIIDAIQGVRDVSAAVYAAMTERNKRPRRTR